ncbi:hypothetical protein MWU78_13125 [Arenibacter sp. F26102]|uniref:hypothetical protein n=1 Tax=Arenibacter sp. F26102 TaxID=2926416 RepID=UPI001FF5F40A|nr:hypothetical protein [Arenibacter sp. F26102]MCK0146591.1 hypothetical protein [Arenibacter sp. F26102]
MKKILGIVFLMLFLVSATEIASTKIQNPNTIEGTWELVSFNNYDGNDVVKTIPPTEGYRQIKMYYNGKVMWTRYVPTDSIEWFGYGSYVATDSTLTEKLEFMSSSMRKVANENMEWHMELKLEGDKYSQIFIDADGNRINSENYKRLN